MPCGGSGVLPLERSRRSAAYAVRAPPRSSGGWRRTGRSGPCACSPATSGSSPSADTGAARGGEKLVPAWLFVLVGDEMPGTVDARVALLAERNDGVVSLGQLRCLGMRDST